jgi:hypothetical protein
MTTLGALNEGRQAARARLFRSFPRANGSGIAQDKGPSSVGCRFGPILRRLSATALACAVQTEEAAKRGKLHMRTSVLNTTDSPGIASDSPGIVSASESRLSPASVAQPISRTQELAHLAQADWHIAEVKSHIKRQRLRVEHAFRTGEPSDLVNSMLDAFESSLRALQKHRNLVLNQLQHRLSEPSH